MNIITIESTANVFVKKTNYKFLLSAIHNWHGIVRFGLPLDVGDFVEILEESGPWFRGK